MKLYGARPKDTLGCAYGCCGNALARGLKHTEAARAARRVAKKRARREARRLAAD
jgi:hypothetical protein